MTNIYHDKRNKKHILYTETIPKSEKCLNMLAKIKFNKDKQIHLRVNWLHLKYETLYQIFEYWKENTF